MEGLEASGYGVFRGWVSVERGFCEEWMKKKRKKSVLHVQELGTAVPASWTSGAQIFVVFSNFKRTMTYKNIKQKQKQKQNKSD